MRPNEHLFSISFLFIRRWKICFLPLLCTAYVASFADISNFPVIRNGNFAWLNAVDIFEKDLIPPLYFLFSCSSNNLGYLMPSVRGFPIIYCQSIFKRLVLLGCPGQIRVRGRIPARCHFLGWDIGARLGSELMWYD